MSVVSAQELPPEFGAIQTAPKKIGRVTGLAVPRFVSLKKAPTNIRKGPDNSYAIMWTYQKSGFPVEVINEFDTWQKIQDSDGSQGWVHQAMVSGRRSVISFEGTHDIYRGTQANSAIVAHMTGGVIAQLLRCKPLMCLIQYQDYKGWIAKKSIYGVYEDEVF